MEAQCGVCGRRMTISEARLVRGLFDFDCDGCGTPYVATRNGVLGGVTKRVATKAILTADDDDAIRDLHVIAEKAHERRASLAPPLAGEIDASPSVRHAIRASYSLIPVEMAPVERRQVEVGQPVRAKSPIAALAIGTAAVALAAACGYFVARAGVASTPTPPAPTASVTAGASAAPVVAPVSTDKSDQCVDASASAHPKASEPRRRSDVGKAAGPKPQDASAAGAQDTNAAAGKDGSAAAAAPIGAPAKAQAAPAKAQAASAKGAAAAASKESAASPSVSKESDPDVPTNGAKPEAAAAPPKTLVDAMSDAVAKGNAKPAQKPPVSPNP